MHYRFEYGKLSEGEVIRFCDLYLLNKDYVREIVAFSKLSNKFSFDILRAIVSECNIYAGQDKKFSDIVKYLNIPNPFENEIYLTYTVDVNGKTYHFSDRECSLENLLTRVDDNSNLSENSQLMNFHIDSSFIIPGNAIDIFAKRIARSIYFDSLYNMGDHELLLHKFLNGSLVEDYGDKASEIEEYADLVIGLNKSAEESVSLVYDKLIQIMNSVGERTATSFFSGYIHVNPRDIANFIKSGKDSAVIPSTIGEITVSHKVYNSYGFHNSGF